MWSDAFRQQSTKGGSMQDGFAFVQAVFHIALFLVVHGARARNRTIVRRKNQLLKRKEVP
jgi:hypothetical protein